ncbi:hypothetical protein LL06_04035 [Hoeflea sp. BAL378]|nr:hypothetical protein LL06_04035 [Hoeflea sp. BAL378]
MASSGKLKTTVWGWQGRFAEAQIEGLLSDKIELLGKAWISTSRTADANRTTQSAPKISLSRRRSCAFRTTV